MQQPDLEAAPLLDKKVDNVVNNTAPENMNRGGCVPEIKLVNKWTPFYFLCFLTGQYHVNNFIETRLHICVRYLKAIVFLTGIILVLCHLSLRLYHVASSIIAEVYSIDNSSYNDTTECNFPSKNWKFSSAITITAIAAFVSYFLFTVLIFIPAIGNQHCGNNVVDLTCSSHRKAFENDGISPFDEPAHTTARNFYLNYLFVLFLFVVCVCISATSLHLLSECSTWAFGLNITVVSISLHFYSQFCAIHSCFIFSKIVSKIQLKLVNLAANLDRADFPENNLIHVPNDEIINQLVQSNDREKVDRGRYFWLQKMYQEFSQLVTPTIVLFGIWLIIHWVLYMIPTVLFSAVVIEFIVDTFQVKLDFSFLNFSFFYSVLPAIVLHPFLLFYPLCCAVSIANARTNFIKTVSKKRWLNIPLAMQSNFVQYLTTDNFGFKSPVFNTLVTVDIKWVYLTFLFIVISAALI